METESELKNVPTFVFYQGRIGEEEFEKGIIVSYYRDGCIEFDQQDNPKVILNETEFERFVKSVRKNLKQAKALRQ